MKFLIPLLIAIILLFPAFVFPQPLMYSVEYGNKPAQPPGLEPVFYSSYLGFENVYVVKDNWYYASRQRADSIKADAFLIPGGNTSDVPFYDGSLDSYVNLLKNPGRPALGFCAGIQFLMMARGGICALRSGEHGNQTATIFEYDEIFEGCPNPYTDRAAHTYSIVDIPDCFRNMATTRICYPTFARHITMPLYGTQLHIERMNNPNSAGPAVISNFRNKIMARKFHGISEVVGFPGHPGKVLLTWWKARTDKSVTYQVFSAMHKDEIDFNSPIYETTTLQYEVSGLNPAETYDFAVRALCEDFVDSNAAIFPLKPDGHRTIVFQNGLAIDGTIYNDCEATTIYQTNPNSNYGLRGSPGKGTLYWWNSGLVQFKGLDKYLDGKKIIAGKLTFIFVGGVEDYTDNSHVANINIYRVLKKWNEGEGFDHQEANSGEVTWNSAQHNVLNWEIPGCKGVSDRVPEPITTCTLKGDGTGIAFDGTVLLPPEMIQTWIEFPDSNCGLLYEKIDTYPNDEYFYFEDNDDDWFMNHPRLTIYYVDESGTDIVDEQENDVPATFILLQNYPNPFNRSTIIPIEITEAKNVILSIYNIEGQLVRKLIDGALTPGSYQLTWDGRNAIGKLVASGLYLYTLEVGNQISVKRMLLLR